MFQFCIHIYCNNFPGYILQEYICWWTGPGWWLASTTPPTYQARGRGVRQWRLSCIQQECSIGVLTLSCTQSVRHSSSAARWYTGPCTSWLTWPLWRLTSLSEMKQIMAKQFPGGVTNMFVISIIIKISWIVLPFQNADNNCLLMYVYYITASSFQISDGWIGNGLCGCFPHWLQQMAPRVPAEILRELFVQTLHAAIRGDMVVGKWKLLRTVQTVQYRELAMSL